MIYARDSAIREKEATLFVFGLHQSCSFKSSGRNLGRARSAFVSIIPSDVASMRSLEEAKVSYTCAPPTGW